MQPGQQPLRVVEIGFGRGFNIGVLRQRWQQDGHGRRLEIHGFEPFPQDLEPWPPCPPALRPWMPWWGEQPGSWEGVDPPWSLHIHRAEAQQEAPWADIGLVDLFLLDLFSPRHHADQWRAPLFERIAAHAREGAVLTSYCCARSVREGLASCGWEPVVLHRSGWRDTLVAHFHASSK